VRRLPLDPQLRTPGYLSLLILNRPVESGDSVPRGKDVIVTAQRGSVGDLGG
jgi:hypothetical protein